MPTALGANGDDDDTNADDDDDDNKNGFTDDGDDNIRDVGEVFLLGNEEWKSINVTRRHTPRDQ